MLPADQARVCVCVMCDSNQAPSAISLIPSGMRLSAGWHTLAARDSETTLQLLTAWNRFIFSRARTGINPAHQLSFLGKSPTHTLTQTQLVNGRMIPERSNYYTDTVGYFSVRHKRSQARGRTPSVEHKGEARTRNGLKVRHHLASVRLTN